MSQDVHKDNQKKQPPGRPPPPKLTSSSKNSPASTPPTRPSRPPNSSQQKVAAGKPSPVPTPRRQGKDSPNHCKAEKRNMDLSASLTRTPPSSYLSLQRKKETEKRDTPPARPDYSPVFFVKHRSKSSEDITSTLPPFLAVPAATSSPSQIRKTKSPHSTYTPPPVMRASGQKGKDGLSHPPTHPVPPPRRNKKDRPEPPARNNIVKKAAGIQSRTPPAPRGRPLPPILDKDLISHPLPQVTQNYPSPSSSSTPLHHHHPSHSLPEDIYSIPTNVVNRSVSLPVQSEPDAIEWYAISGSVMGKKGETSLDSPYALPRHQQHDLPAVHHSETIEWYASTDDIGMPNKGESLSTNEQDVSEDGYMVMSSITGHVGSSTGSGGEEEEDNEYVPLNPLKRDDENTYSVPGAVFSKDRTRIAPIIEEGELSPLSLSLSLSLYLSTHSLLFSFQSPHFKQIPIPHLPWPQTFTHL